MILLQTKLLPKHLGKRYEVKFLKFYPIYIKSLLHHSFFCFILLSTVQKVISKSSGKESGKKESNIDEMPKRNLKRKLTTCTETV